MKFKINLNPNPGAPYFTVSEHEKSYDKKPHNTEDNLTISEKLLRELFVVPEEFRISFHDCLEKKNALNNFKWIIIQDNPVDGVNRALDFTDSDTHPALLDISYSFPHSMSNSSAFDGLLIDPNASLGIPTGFIILFTKAGIQLPKNQFEANPKQIFVMRKVLEDYAARGLELLIRESNYKAAVLYQLIENDKNLESLIDKKNKSKTMISLKCDFNFVTKLKKLGYVFTYQNHEKSALITLANYPTHSKEMVEMLSDRISIV